MNMKTLSIFTLSLLLLNPLELDGHFWSMFGQEQKEAVVSGIVIGNAWTIGQLVADRTITRAKAKSLMFGSASVAHILRYLDDFYSEPENLFVLVGKAVLTCRKISP